MLDDTRPFAAATPTPLPTDHLPTDQARDQVKPTRRHPRLRWVLFAAILVSLAAEFRFAEPYVANAFRTLRHVDTGWVLLAVITQISSMMAFTRVQRRMLAAGGARVSLLRMASVVWAANAVNATLPAGSALSWQYGYRRLRGWGATVPAAGFTLLASGLLSTITFTVLIVIGAVGSGLNTLLISGALVLAIAGPTMFYWRRRPAGVTVTSLLLGVGRTSITQGCRVVRRSPEGALASLEKFVSDLTAIRPNRRDWIVGVGMAAVNWVADLACLLACLEAVDVAKWTLFLALVAFVAGKSASSVTFLPGGLGVVDAAMILALTAGGVPTAGATAGVVLYRLISLVMVVAIGWLAAAVAWILERRVMPTVRERVEDALELPETATVRTVVEAVSDAVTPSLAPEGIA